MKRISRTPRRSTATRDQPDDLLVGQRLLRRHPLQALRGHAVGAAQVAPVGEGDAQIGRDAAVAVGQPGVVGTVCRGVRRPRDGGDAEVEDRHHRHDNHVAGVAVSTISAGPADDPQIRGRLRAVDAPAGRPGRGPCEQTGPAGPAALAGRRGPSPGQVTRRACGRVRVGGPCGHCRAGNGLRRDSRRAADASRAATPPPGRRGAGRGRRPGGDRRGQPDGPRRRRPAAAGDRPRDAGERGRRRPRRGVSGRRGLGVGLLHHRRRGRRRRRAGWGSWCARATCSPGSTTAPARPASRLPNAAVTVDEGARDAAGRVPVPMPSRSPASTPASRPAARRSRRRRPRSTPEFLRHRKTARPPRSGSGRATGWGSAPRPRWSSPTSTPWSSGSRGPRRRRDGGARARRPRSGRRRATSERGRVVRHNATTGPRQALRRRRLHLASVRGPDSGWPPAGRVGVLTPPRQWLLVHPDGAAPGRPGHPAGQRRQCSWRALRGSAGWSR